VEFDISGNYTASSFRAKDLFNFTEEMRINKQPAKQQQQQLNELSSAKR